jgi:cation:H+ antiporter
MDILIHSLMFALSCIFLLASGSFFIKSLIKIASFLKMSEFVVSFIIVGIATSLPELFVGISAALSNQPEISLGNVIGSNIANLTIILGLPILLARGIKINNKAITKDSYYMFVIALLPFLLMIIGNSISRIDGIILISVFIGYCVSLIRQQHRYSKHMQDKISKWQSVINSFVFLLSAIGLFYSAKLTVKYASLISIDLALPAMFIGLFIIALGTSLPELVVGLQSIFKKKEDIILGNILGSVVANSTLILGVTALITPISVNPFLFFSSFFFLFISMVLFVIFLKTKKRFSWKESIAMILVYIIFIMVEMSTKNITI